MRLKVIQIRSMCDIDSEAKFDNRPHFHQSIPNSFFGWAVSNSVALDRLYAIERPVTSEHLKKDDAKCPDVDLHRLVLLSLVNLRRQIHLRTADPMRVIVKTRRHHVQGLNDRAPKVDKLDLNAPSLSASLSSLSTNRRTFSNQRKARIRVQHRDHNSYKRPRISTRPCAPSARGTHACRPRRSPPSS